MRKIVCLLLLCCVMPVLAEDKAISRHIDIELPADIKKLLREEMEMILHEMEYLNLQLASGKFQAIEKSGKALRDGYIMKQQLTNEQKYILMQRLPEEFKALDHDFHRHAGLLAEAASQRDAELVNFYIYKMNEGCVACHSRFAAERFPGFDLSDTNSEKN